MISSNLDLELNNSSNKMADITVPPSGNQSASGTCTDGVCLQRHPHWQQFEDGAYGVHVSLGLVMAIVCFLSVTGNSFVIYVYTK